MAIIPIVLYEHDDNFLAIVLIVLRTYVMKDLVAIIAIAPNVT